MHLSEDRVHLNLTFHKCQLGVAWMRSKAGPLSEPLGPDMRKVNEAT